MVINVSWKKEMLLIAGSCAATRSLVAGFKVIRQQMQPPC
jgi:hypothetical protein